MVDYQQSTSSPRHTVKLSQQEVAQAIRVYLRYRRWFGDGGENLILPPGTDTLLFSAREERRAEALGPITLVVIEETTGG